jgi:multidrug efflux pump subunit AcrA (membrane-fusion protein)
MSISKSIKDMPAGQRRAGKAITVFFALMAGFTVLSRGLDSFTVARVEAGEPSFGALTHEIVLSGKAEPLGENAVVLPEGYVVKELFLREGAAVAAGDVVAVLDTAQIEQLLADAERELESAQLDAAARNVKPEVLAGDAVAKAELQLERAKEDALVTEEAARQVVDRAANAARRARNDRWDLHENGEDTDEALWEAATEAVVLAEIAQEDAELAYQKAVTEGERAIADAELAIEEAERAEAEKELADAADAEARRLETGRDYLGVTALQTRIAELEALLAEEGRITADSSGLVTALHIKPGDMTTAGGAYLLAGQTVGSLFTAPASEDEAERLAAGDNVRLVVPGMKDAVSTKLSAIKPPEEPGGEYSLEVLLPDLQLPPGTPGTLEAVKRSGENTLVPLTSLYSEGSEDRGYVFILRERSTTMGVQTVVERLDVEIIERGDTRAAVNAAFSPDDEIAVASSRPLLPGDRVRLEPTP